MIRNSAVTMYHETEEGWQRMFFCRVSLHCQNGIRTGEPGQASKNAVTLRIFTQQDCSIAPGDKVIPGYCESLLPPTENAYTVLEVTDNRRGSGRMQHYKVVAA